jgi:hypothetical protein
MAQRLEPTHGALAPPSVFVLPSAAFMQRKQPPKPFAQSSQACRLAGLCFRDMTLAQVHVGYLRKSMVALL